jgi:peptide/nickel transport system substrate-binding protein
MRTLRSTLAGVSAAILAAALASCASQPGSAAAGSNATSASGPVQGGTLRMSISAEPGCLDAHAISATSRHC